MCLWLLNCIYCLTLCTISWFEWIYWTELKLVHFTTELILNVHAGVRLKWSGTLFVAGRLWWAATSVSCCFMDSGTRCGGRWPWFLDCLSLLYLHRYLCQCGCTAPERRTGRLDPQQHYPPVSSSSKTSLRRNQGTYWILTLTPRTTAMRTVDN